MSSLSHQPQRRQFRAAAALIAAGALAFCVAACSPGDGGGDDVQSAVSMRTANDPSASGTANGNGSGNGNGNATLESDPAPAGDYSTQAAEATPGDGSYLGIKDVRIGSHDDFDRIVFEFTGEGVPGYWVRYEDMPTQQGSGRPITVAGAHKLAIDVRGTGYPFDFDMDDYPSGPVRPDDTDAIAEVVGAGTFEGSSQYVVGIDGERRPFKVFQVNNPTRLIIDIQTS